MTIKVDKEQALELLRAAIDDKGESHVDPSFDQGRDCEYYAVTKVSIESDGEVYEEAVIDTGADGRALPGCIVGHVCYQLGIDPQYLQSGMVDNIVDFDGYILDKMKYFKGSAPVQGRIKTLAGEEVQLDTEAQVTLGYIQFIQDKGKTWGEALTKTEKEFGNG